MANKRKNLRYILLTTFLLLFGKTTQTYISTPLPGKSFFT